MEIVHVFERISGARLNFEKSTIVSLDDDPPQPWIINSGCKIARPREVLLYLGLSYWG